MTKMTLTLFPMVGLSARALELKEGALIIGDTVVALRVSPEPEGDEPFVPDHALLAGPIRQDADGRWQVRMILPITKDASEAARFPAPIEIEQDGPISLPG